MAPAARPGGRTARCVRCRGVARPYFMFIEFRVRAARSIRSVEPRAPRVLTTKNEIIRSCCAARLTADSPFFETSVRALPARRHAHVELAPALKATSSPSGTRPARHRRGPWRSRSASCKTWRGRAWSPTGPPFRPRPRRAWPLCRSACPCSRAPSPRPCP